MVRKGANMDYCALLATTWRFLATCMNLDTFALKRKFNDIDCVEAAAYKHDDPGLRGNKYGAGRLTI